MVVCVGLALAAPHPAALAASEDGFSAQRPSSEYWQGVPGLATNTIPAILQTSDGYLWVGTYEGLYRFDGVKFDVFDSHKVPAWHDATVTALHEAADGTLWIGHSRGAVSAFRKGKFTVYPARAPSNALRVQAFVDEPGGSVWVFGSKGGVTRPGGEPIAEVGRPGEVDDATGIARANDGRIWRLVKGRLTAFCDGRFAPLACPAVVGDEVMGIARRRAGGFWVLAGGRLWREEAGRWEFSDEIRAMERCPLSVFIEGADGRLFLGTYSDGVLVLRPGDALSRRWYGLGNGLPSGWVISMCGDHEGGVWLGSGSSGLFRLQERKVEMLAAPDSWQGRSVLTMSRTADGGFLVGTEGAGLYRMDASGVWTRSDLTAGLRNNFVWSVGMLENGDLLAGTWEGLDIGRAGHFARGPGTEDFNAPTTALVPARRGGFWVGNDRGLAHYERGELRWVEPEDRRRLFNVRSVVETPEGALWVGCHGVGLGHVKGGEVRHYRREDGLSNDYAQGLLLEPDGTLWIGTQGGGLNRFKEGRFTSIGVENGLGSSSISQIEDDGLGYLWMSSRGGLLRVEKAQLNAFADGRIARIDCLVYGLENGLSTLSCASSQFASGCRMPDGRIVFATDRGLALVDPARVAANPHPPPVALESVLVDSHPVGTAPFAGPVQVGPGVHRLEIRYTGLSFVVPGKVQFKYRLLGFDRDWVGGHHERRALYSSLAPGRYEFQVTAANNDGVWNATGCSLQLLVLPFYWQTFWFRILLVLLALGAVAGGVWVQARRRLLLRVAQLERQHAIEAERTRIANDMHDDVGAALTRITMLASTARSDLDHRPRLERRLEQIHEAARAVTRAVDEIVWAVNPRHDTLESLACYLERYSQDFLGAAGLRCRLDLPGEFPAWRPSAEVRHNLFLALKEALNNVVRHARAQSVTVTLALDSKGLRLRVDDDGCGLSAAHAMAAAPGRIATGNGLPGMHRRMELIGGSCSVRNGPEGGTIVEFYVANARGTTRGS